MVRRIFVFLAIAISAGITIVSIVVTPVWWLFFIVGPLILLRFYDMLQNKHAIRKNFPVIENLRYFFESIRPEIMQYFVETDTEGRPFDRIDRSLVYRRSKNVSDTTPFGTQENTYKAGYEWINYSLYAKSHHDFEIDARVTVGGKDCLKPYSCSVLNISAMSFGSLSSKAIESLNGGAKLQNFAHNTGEGGTGAAPVEFSDSVGTPFLDGLAFVHETLVKYGLREKLKISASGKVVTGFHIARALAMGADFCQSARAMMMSLGCIQALLCNKNTCPVGIAKQDKKLMKGLDVENKTVRVANYHKKTVDSFKEILLAAGITEKEQLTRSHINHRIESNVIKTYEEMYPSMVAEKMGVLN